MLLVGRLPQRLQTSRRGRADIEMDHEFWLQRWREGRIGFHQDRTTPALERYREAMAWPAGSRLFVPFAGKSLDMLWLAARGHRVLGIELSPLAVEQFFAEHQLVPEVRHSRYGVHHVAGAIEVIQGDAFGLDAAALADCAGVFDRGALVALPPSLRARYANEVYAALPVGCRGLLLTFEYAQTQMQGPPFAVLEAEVRSLFSSRWRIDLLQRRDVLAEEPRFAAAGLTALDDVAWRLERLADPVS